MKVQGKLSVVMTAYNEGSRIYENIFETIKIITKPHIESDDLILLSVAFTMLSPRL